MLTRTCPRCQSNMAEGFVPNEQHGMMKVLGWIAGKPQIGWWGTITNKAKPIDIATWRCSSCGFLEHYAKG